MIDELKKEVANVKHSLTKQVSYTRSDFYRTTLHETNCVLQVALTSFLVCNQGSLLGLRMHDHKSLCAAVMICSTLINIQTLTQTDRHTDRQTHILTSLYEKLSQLS